MSNSYFNFKQFTVHQQHCAMKVCTDACLFGAWLAHHAAVVNCSTVLDIGTGTGLLPLLLAQQLSSATIEAIEIDELAAMQAGSNFKDSKWHERLQVFHTDAKAFTTSKKYDLIVSNPPFFKNDLKSANIQRNLALHSDALSLEEVVSIAKKYATINGIMAFLLPYHRCNYFEKIAEQNNLHLSEKRLVRQTDKHGYFRAMLLYSQKKATPVLTEITIKEESNNYSKAFIDLLQPYYANL